MNDIGIPENMRNPEPEPTPELPDNVVKEEIYRIRNQDGLYSKGGRHVHWSKTGKVWKKIGHLKNHLGQSGCVNSPRGYNTGCVVEKVTRLCIEAVEELPLVDFINEIEQQKRQKEAEQQRRFEEDKRRREYELYLKLKEKFEND